MKVLMSITAGSSWVKHGPSCVFSTTADEMSAFAGTAELTDNVVNSDTYISNENYITPNFLRHGAKFAICVHGCDTFGAGRVEIKRGARGAGWKRTVG
jgi:hypothetical protein